MTRKELIQSDEYWKEIISNLLLPANRHHAVKQIIELKNELLHIEEQEPSKGAEDKPTRKEPIEQKVRKVLQSVALHGYDLICAESDILKAMEQYRAEGIREELIKFYMWLKDVDEDTTWRKNFEMDVDKYLSNKQKS